MECLKRIEEFRPVDMVYDSREVSEGFVFFAIKGTKVDANRFVPNILAKFKRVLVVSENGFDDERCIKVDDVRKCMGLAADHFFNHPSKKLKVVGITGTNGKTTTTYLLRSIFDNSEIIGTTGWTLKDERFKLNNTTPESLDLHRILNRMAMANSEYCFTEVSSHALSFNRIEGVDFALKVFTNISQDHLDFYDNLENYAKTKLSFFERLKPKVVNADDSYGRMLIDAATISYGFSDFAFIKPIVYEYSLDGIKAKLNVARRTISITSPLIGDYNLYNIMAALGVALFFGVDFARIEEGIAKSKGAPGRLEFFQKDGAYAVVDYAHTDDAMRNVLEALNKIKKGRIITVFGAGGDRDRTKRPKMGSIAESLSDVVVVTSDNPRSEEPLAIIDDILEGISDRDRVIVEPDRFEAIKKALGMAEKGDLVTILGKGHEDYQILKDKTIHFDDREVVRRLWNLD
ncbi:UDP-N-acetylmuramoyl-L-alanyl-D-glutamate--2,6-diaminopimelate ligase [Hippea maritima]|uniref:UDP-N-acetylmuramoyl-L-alanyl-D-glutamate--2,6-diaminopimelate ligase n=1 Tax=Hippea maritima (strain ATCC 700847 / DSM 10411 / MH2) TaxID=760142 RepID=F2LTV4_HIPMA|nr:UDP-N-acetylmuramoyl-L-alanyl-D-glutamate--2,6-diaminopimelate ligase [Hippea maritima]AEA34480.1 UDP-N-acetylmuramoyl-L-alanyl-D-glutamate--2,6-diaminopimelateligase [Hippea maritima DSM 10411]